MEVYVNDMLVKRLDCSDHMKHLEETFAFLGKFNVKLNHEKCTLEVASVKFLRYLVTQWGIKANTDQIFAILEMKSPNMVKKVQILNGHLATFNRFLSRSTDKCKPFLLLCHQEERSWLLLKQWVWGSIPKFEGLFGISLTSLQATSRRNVAPLPSSLWHCSMRNFDSRRRGHPKASLICQQGSDRCPGETHEDWEAIVRSLHHHEKVEALLSTLPHRHADRVPLEDYCGKPQANDRITKWVMKIRPLGVTFGQEPQSKGDHGKLHLHVHSRNPTTEQLYEKVDPEYGWSIKQ